MRQY